MKHVVQFSGGIASWATAKRVVEQHGIGDVVLLFADTLIEDEDLYRFIDDAARNVGVPITRLCEGRTPWQVFNDEKYIANSRVDICSRVLKREVLNEWRAENCTPEDSVFYIGFDWTEQHRAEKLLKYVAPWRYEFPLFNPPFLTKEGMKSWAVSEGLKLPRLYDMGFEHNNCGGFCVKAGHGHFRHLLKMLPDRYAHHEQQESSLRVDIGDYAILRDRSGGKTKPMTLEDFRKRIESEKQTPDPYEEDWGGCGCATDYDESDLVQIADSQ